MEAHCAAELWLGGGLCYWSKQPHSGAALNLKIIVLNIHKIQFILNILGSYVLGSHCKH